MIDRTKDHKKSEFKTVLIDGQLCKVRVSNQTDEKKQIDLETIIKSVSKETKSA